MAKPLRVLVMGAINQDEVARVSRHPVPGETVVTNSITFFSGGKGANQAAAAATAGLGIDVQMLGAVGDDAVGDDQLSALRDSGVDVSLIRRVIGTPTGRAYITVSDDAQNSIVVGLGANAFVSPVNLNGAAAPDVVVAQTEIGRAPIEALAAFAVRSGSRMIINNAPVVELSAETLRTADPLVVNQFEARDMLVAAGVPIVGLDPLAIAIALAAETSSRSVIVTLGAQGCAVVDDRGARSISAEVASSVVDTTGAGDMYVGTLAAALAANMDLDDAIRHAASAAAVSVAHDGARMPVPALVERSVVNAASSRMTAGNIFPTR